MTAAQIQARVDAWLAARADGIARLEYFGLLARQWRDVSREFGADSAAARGVLLGLVRESHGCPSLACGHEGGWGPDWNTWTVSNPPGKGRGCAIISSQCGSEAEALVVALESEP